MKGLPFISLDEMDIMKILWANGKITEKKLVDELMERTEWKLKYIKKLINKLRGNASIKIVQTELSDITYIPGYSEDEFNEHHIFYYNYQKHHFFKQQK